MERPMQKFFKLIVLVALSACSSSPYNSNENLKESVVVVPGKIIQIQLPEFYDKKTINCTVGTFPVSQISEPYFIYAESYFSDMKEKTCVGENLEIRIIVKNKDFPFEELKVDRKRVNLNKKDLARVIRERKILKSVYSGQKLEQGIDSIFKLPLSSKITSDYGKRRLYNKERKGQHLGIDFRAKVGKPIGASNKGRVVLAKDLFYTGNTVIVYHGLGIYTVYGHLSKINVRKNQTINKGEILGLAGKTGRVTGPHLHWGVKVNGQWVNGKDLLSLKF